MRYEVRKRRGGLVETLPGRPVFETEGEARAWVRQNPSLFTVGVDAAEIVPAKYRLDRELVDILDVRRRWTFPAWSAIEPTLRAALSRVKDELQQGNQPGSIISNANGEEIEVNPDQIGRLLPYIEG